jgi:hypothetical protein
MLAFLKKRAQPISPHMHMCAATRMHHAREPHRPTQLQVRYIGLVQLNLDVNVYSPESYGGECRHYEGAYCVTLRQLRSLYAPWTVLQFEPPPLAQTQECSYGCWVQLLLVVLAAAAVLAAGRPDP